MLVMGYDIVVDVDGEESVIQLDDTYPAVNDWRRNNLQSPYRGQSRAAI